VLESQIVTSSTPLITIAIPTLNGEKYIEECLRSACGQTYENTEILVLDDGSVDDTLAIADAFGRADQRVRVQRNAQRKGLCGNFTACLHEASGSWVKYLLQDDSLDAECVERMVAVARPDCPMVVCGRRYVYEGVDEKRRLGAESTLRVSIASEVSSPSFISASDFRWLVMRHLSVNFVGEPVAVMVNRFASLGEGDFDPRFLQMVDLEYFVRLGVRYGAVVVPEALASFRVHPAQATATHLAEKPLQTMYFDDLLYVANLAYSPHYADLRAWGLKQRPAIDVRRIARTRLRRARRALLARSPGDWEVGAAADLWESLIANDPIVGPYASREELRRAALRDAMTGWGPRCRIAAGHVLRRLPAGDGLVGRLELWRGRRAEIRRAPPAC